MARISPNLVIEKCQQAGLSFWTASRVALDLKESLHSRMDDDEINLHITNALRKIDGEAAAMFEGYHSIHVRTSKNMLEAFDRKKISDSLVRETRVPRSIAETIAQEVEEDIRRLQLKNISASLIREMVNANLIQKRMSDAKLKYTRVGLPVYDIKKILERETMPDPYQLNQMFGNKMFEEYTLTRILPSEISNAYLNSDIYIHALEHFITSPCTFQNDLRPFLRHGFSLGGVIDIGPAKYGEVAVLHAARVLLTSKRYVGRGVGLDFFNIFLSPYLANRKDKEIKQIAQSFFFELNRAPSPPHAFTVNLDMELPKFLENEEAIGPGGKTVGVYGDFEEEAMKFNEIFLSVMKKGDRAGNPFVWPKIGLKFYKNIDSKFLMSPYYILSQSAKNQSLVHQNVISARADGGLRTGVMQAVSLNIAKFAKLSRDERDFYSTIEDNLNISRDLAVVKKNAMKRRLYKSKSLSFLAQFFDGREYIKTDDFCYLVSFTGLPQACMTFLNLEEYDKSCVRLSERIVRFALRKFREYKRENNLRFCLGENPEKGVLERFGTQNKLLGIDMGLDAKIIPDSYEEKGLAYAKLQPLFEGGAFFEFDVSSEKRTPSTKSKNFLFLAPKT